MTQQLWFIQPLVTGVFFTLGIILFFQLLVNAALHHYALQRQEIDKIDFSVGRLRLISVIYFSVWAVFFEYSAAHVQSYVAFINFRLLLLIFIIVFLGFWSSTIIMFCDVLAHLVFYNFSMDTLYHMLFIVTIFLLGYLGVYLIRKNGSPAPWILIAAEGMAIIIWVTVHFVNISGIGTVSLREMWYNIVTYFILEALLFYGLTILFNENQQLLTVTQQASIDSLTKLKNYNVFVKEYTQHFTQVRQLQQPLTLVALDIDCFKGINDHYGHLAGNEVLRSVGALLQTATQQFSGANCYRTGGEEFIILLPNLANVDSYQFARQLQTQIEKLLVEYNHEVIKITISVGIASLRDDDKESDHLFERADQMLYLSKGRGRNLVTTDEMD